MVFLPRVDADLQRYYNGCLVKLNSNNQDFWTYVDRICWYEENVVGLWGYKSNMKRDVYRIPAKAGGEGNATIISLWPEHGYYQWKDLAFWVSRIPERQMQRAASLRTLRWYSPLTPYLPNAEGLNPPMEWTDCLSAIDLPVLCNTISDARSVFNVFPHRSVVVHSRDWALSLAPVATEKFMLWFQAVPVAYITEDMRAKVIAPWFKQEIIDTFGGELHAIS